MGALTRCLVVLALIDAGCTADLDGPRGAPELDRSYFDCKVQPVLTEYCSQLACHGKTERYFHFYSRNRLRDDADETKRNAFLRDSERSHNFDAVRALVDVDAPEDSLLLRKPLEQSAGGAFHRGATLYGAGNVFDDANDPDYQIIAQWIDGATEVPTCKEPNSDM